MPGETFYPGEKKALPGVYVRIINVGPAAVPAVRQGVVAALLSGSWGPIGVPTDVATIGEAYAHFGRWGGADLAAELIYGGARVARVVRVGAGGNEASVVLTDDAAGSPVPILTLHAKYPGVRPNPGVEDWKVAVRDSLAYDDLRELVLYAGATLLETIAFPKTGVIGGESQALLEAIAAAGSPWLGPATDAALGSGVLKAEPGKPFGGGQDPTAPTIEDYTDALTAVEKQAFNFVTADSHDPAVHAAIKGFVDRLVVAGIYPIGVVAEEVDENWETRLTNAKSYNDANMIYVGNGFVTADKVVHEGYRAAGRLAGMIAAAPYTDAITNLTVPGAVSIHGELTVSELTAAKSNGMLTLRYNASGLPVVTQGINTLVSPASNQDDGWKKIRRVRQRYNLIERCVLATDRLVGRIPNDTVGQEIVMNEIRRVLAQLVAEGALRNDPAPTVEIDPTLQPTAGPDESYYLMGFVDNDSMEFIYQTFGTQLVAPFTAAA